MAVSFYFDENSFDRALLQACQRLRLPVITAREARLEGASDEVHLDFAAAQGLTLVTADVKDFARLHKEWLDRGRHHRGIVLRRQRATIGDTARQLAVGAAMPALDDQLVYLSR